MINKENIEEKLFDYVEGNLSASEQLAVEAFVQSNPEYQADFDAWTNASVPQEDMQYRFADELLVEESAQPRGWLTWARGGAIVFVLGALGIAAGTHLGEGNQNTHLVAQNASSADLNIASSELMKSNQQSVESTELKGKEVVASDLSAQAQLVDENVNPKSNEVVKAQAAVSALSSKGAIVQVTKADNHKDVQAKKSVVNATSGQATPVVKSNNDKSNSTEKAQALLQTIAVQVIRERVLVPGFLPDEVNSEKFKKTKWDPMGVQITNLGDPSMNYNAGFALNDNGSFAGSNTEGVRVEYMYRKEWPTLHGEDYNTHMLSVDKYVDAVKGGIGFVYTKDIIGHGKLTGVSYGLVYAPKLTFKGISVSPSVRATYNTQHILWNLVESNDIKDARTGVLYGSVPFVSEENHQSSFNYIDYSAGLLINTAQFYIGGQFQHLNKPSYSDEQFDQEIVIPGRITLQAGTDIRRYANKSLVYSPSVSYVQFGNYQSFWLSNQVKFKSFLAALGVASDSQLLINLGYASALGRITYGYSLSSPKEYSGLNTTDMMGSHQINLRINLNPKK